MNRDDVIGYIDLYSNERFEEAVNSYFTKDAYFWNTRIALRGTQKIIDWLIASHLGYSEKLNDEGHCLLRKGGVGRPPHILMI